MKILGAFPTYDGNRCNSKAVVDVIAAGGEVAERSCSLLGRCFNECWVHALNKRPEVTHFLMVHADIMVLTPKWPQKMVELMTINKADVLSAVMPIKTPKMVTSTALETDDPWNPRKILIEELQLYPQTWTQPDLLINTGLMLVDMRKPWVEKVYFTIDDQIRKDETGKWIAECKPEDWNFSRMVKAEGGTVWATQEIKALHWGRRPHANWVTDEPWKEKK